MNTSSSNTVLPKVAISISLLFIAIGTWITIDASLVQDKVELSTEMISSVEQVEDLFIEIEVAHRVDLKTGGSNWDKKRIELRNALSALSISEFEGYFESNIARTIGHLNEMDQLHIELMNSSSAKESTKISSDLKRSSASFKRQLDRIMFSLRNKHLAGGLNDLATRWGYYQFLFLLACSLALLLAFLAKRQKELIVVADDHADQLKGTTKELEKTNIELRETMMSKEEKEMMLKEIHHRVKNNLQIIRSLIRFQAMKVTDPEIEELFNECINRVSAMAVLHEQTYLSKDLANIDVKDYLSMLVQDLTSAYNIDIQLEVETDIQVETLGVDTLMPIGLIINEVISNSLKYAFKDRTSGTIKVSMRPDEDGKFHLTILDDGIGISNLQVWKEADTLGMELIKTLVDQLSGSVELNASSGTSYQISFPKAA